MTGDAMSAVVASQTVIVRVVWGANRRGERWRLMMKKPIEEVARKNQPWGVLID